MSISREEQHSLRTLKALLYPFARYLMRRSIALQTVLESLKQILVEIALEEMEEAGTKVNVSRLSAMTGVHRRDVARILKDEEAAVPISTTIGRVLGHWEQDKRFLTASGNPRQLSCDGEENEFRELVHSVSSDLNHGTFLFELERRKLVERSGSKVKLLSSVWEDATIDEGYELLVEDVNHLVSAVEENIYHRGNVPNIHARTEYDNISKKSLPKIKKWLTERNALFHRDARHYISQFDADINNELAEEAGGRIVLGTFSRVEE